ncbi:hypothetical protein AVEN_248652-1 [Araneus ventricosus]|uniref:Uncharacterized protein n=1 Tax=Araneus ventricosus TaxID=182803 RepID=A0A4Y2BZX1_ARAVE|nr:hypothetical protein AVEN_248652-1 [Araneus ventricosus]
MTHLSKWILSAVGFSIFRLHQSNSHRVSHRPQVLTLCDRICCVWSDRESAALHAQPDSNMCRKKATPNEGTSKMGLSRSVFDTEICLRSRFDATPNQQSSATLAEEFNDIFLVASDLWWSPFENKSLIDRGSELSIGIHLTCLRYFSSLLYLVCLETVVIVDIESFPNRSATIRAGPTVSLEQCELPWSRIS